VSAAERDEVAAILADLVDDPADVAAPVATA
jgi:hypothetical protein